jgi:hypothetical protein
MNRKPIAIAIVLLLAALAPLTAITGFCARMPCCGHAPADALSLAIERADCCTTIACYESQSATLSVSAAASFSAMELPVRVLEVPNLSAPDTQAALPPIDTSPPRTTGGRLAQLSTLII